MDPGKKDESIITVRKRAAFRAGYNMRALREFSARAIILCACASCEFISRANE